MNSRLRSLLALIAVSVTLVWCIPLVGQVLKGSISGTVTDPQGAVVSGAQVKATSVETGAVYTTTSDSSGLFRLNLIPAGTYKVDVSAPSFKTTTENNVAVSAGADRGLGTVRLSVGTATEAIEVTAEAPLIETSQSQVTNTFSGTTLQTFAGIQENEGLDNLALFVPGVVSSRDNNFSNFNGGEGFSVNGIRGRNNDQEIDGQNNNDNSVAGPSVFVTDPEFVQQYVIVTNQFGPEYGRNAGSVVNIITKSGTNAWHGSLYGTENNSVLNAMDNPQKRFDVNPDGSRLTKPPRLNDEFAGFTIGGPLAKNKLFIFGGFDEERVSTTANFHADDLSPTPAGLATLSGCYPNSQSVQDWIKFGAFGITAGNPVATTVPIDPNHPDLGRSFVNINLPAQPSRGLPACPGVQFGGISRFLPAPVHTVDWTLRSDLVLPHDTFTARYLFNKTTFFNLDFGLNEAAAGYPGNEPALGQVMLLSWTHNLTAHMVNEARVSYGRLNVDFGGNTIGNVPSGHQLDQAVAEVTFRFPANTFYSGVPALPFLRIGTLNNLPQFRIVNTWQGQDNWNYVVGKHGLKAGANYTFQRSPNGFLPNVNGGYRFDSWNDFVANRPDRARIAAGPTGVDFREHDLFVYGGDDWKIAQSLTLNLGLTWSYYGQPANLFHDITTARETQSPPTAFWLPTVPLSVRTYPTFPAPKHSFGPSVGFAYSPQWGGFLTGHGKTVIRGGYRLLYDPPFYNIYLNMATAAPEVFLQTFSGGAARTKAMPASLLGPDVRASLSPFLTPGVFDPRTFNQTSMTPDFGPDKVNSYSFGIERQITQGSAFEARYVGNHAYHLFQSINGNPFVADLQRDFPSLVPASITPCPATQQAGPTAGLGFNSDVGRVSCGPGVLRLRTNSGYSYYNGVQLEFRANNLFKQLTMRTGYTWSKTLDNVSEIFSTFGGGNTVAFAQNPLNTTTGEKSFSGLDIPHQWTLLFTEQLPFFKEQHGVMGHLLGGWALSGNYVLASGQRYTPSQAFSAFATANGNYYDIGFLGPFIGVDQARPFVGNLSAPATSVGILAADACALFGACTTASTNPNQLLSLNAINATPSTAPAPSEVQTNANAVRFIVNAVTAQTMFNTPFGNAPRNIVQDAMTNIGNFTIFKNVKITERVNFRFHTTMLNAFNHFNYTTIDPFVEDAGIATLNTGFGDPTVTHTPGFPEGRRIIFGMRISF